VTPLGALLWAAACHGAFQLAAYGLSLLGGALDLMTLGAAQAIVYLGFTWLMLRWLEPAASLRQSLALRPTHIGLGLIGMALGVALKLPAESLSRSVERWFPTPESQLSSRAALYRSDTLAQVLVLLIVLCVMAPLVEELFFRGACYGRLVRSGPKLAALVSGLTFVVVHPDLRHWPALSLVSAVLSGLRLASGSLLPGLGLHVTFNAAGVLALVLGASSATRPLDVAPAPLLASWLAAGLLLVVLVRLANNPGASRARAEDRA
jgi:membrane protease YdiL (CAAX protease family)